MHPLKSYVVSDTDVFNVTQFPEIALELERISACTRQMPVYFKREIIISFVKDHSIHRDWIKSNPALAQLVVSGALGIAGLEALFASCKQFPLFRSSLESYIKKQLV